MTLIFVIGQLYNTNIESAKNRVGHKTSVSSSK